MLNRSGETEWDQMVNFMKRKIERFVKTMTFELTIPDVETELDEAYKPRFMNEIFNELNVLENKKDPLFCKYLFKIITQENIFKKFLI